MPSAEEIKTESNGVQEQGKDKISEPIQEKLSNAEIKKRKQAEKQAKRAQKKMEQGQEVIPSSKEKATKQEKVPKEKEKIQKPQKPQKTLPIRPIQQVEKTEEPQEKKVALFGHLYGQPRRTTIAGASKDVHPAVLALGLQMSNYVICGSSARCVSTLLAFKKVSIYAFPLSKDGLYPFPCLKKKTIN
jgi:translation initiation factor eIF-2B subunit delta